MATTLAQECLLRALASVERITLVDFPTRQELTLKLIQTPLAQIATLSFVSFSLLLILIIFCTPRSSQRSIAKSSDNTHIQALFTIFAPVAVAWPHEYAHLVSYHTSPCTKTISVSMSSFIGAVCDGSVEIRNYEDLSELFAEKLVVYSWRIDLALDATWNLKVLRFMLTSQYSWRRNNPGPAPYNPNLKRRHDSSEPKSNPEDLFRPFSFSLTSNAHLDLDYLPFSHLESSLLNLRTTLNPGNFATLEFTTPAPHVTFLSPQFTLCAVPFLPRKHARQTETPRSTRPRLRIRTATPLLASLHRILELLTTRGAGPGDALKLENVSNISKDYARALNAAAERLEDVAAMREAFISQWGEAGWREQRLMMGWEAALFSAGLLMRWLVVVRR
ncbi:hypothetical protein R3P38DRAFT_3273601 [Favolaschia claudopus]|uniref:Uncharacterized protein n=1 Tax=Favolaschia claudopus TaxID=2862362 RepID=A0AAW0B0J3_9AGAR